MNNTIEIPTRRKRNFVSENLVIDSWEKIESLFETILIKRILFDSIEDNLFARTHPADPAPIIM